jgi:hypothetical protein
MGKAESTFLDETKSSLKELKPTNCLMQTPLARWAVYIILAGKDYNKMGDFTAMFFK